MFPLAIVCGNTFILKPSERDPGAAMMLAKFAQEAGIPDGVLNIIHGTKVYTSLQITIHASESDLFEGRR
jgi:malonate-semialdehyde dehydrogenase (acetylating)/methylmalonate-semialdehyde dehydrogenase